MSDKPVNASRYNHILREFKKNRERLQDSARVINELRAQREIDLAQSKKALLAVMDKVQPIVERLARASEIINKMREVLANLSKSDPVYGPVRIRGPRIIPTLEDGPSISVRICAICRAQSAHQQENVRHKESCPWIPSKKALSLRLEDKS